VKLNTVRVLACPFLRMELLVNVGHELCSGFVTEAISCFMKMKWCAYRLF